MQVLAKKSKEKSQSCVPILGHFLRLAWVKLHNSYLLYRLIMTSND